MRVLPGPYLVMSANPTGAEIAAICMFIEGQEWKSHKQIRVAPTLLVELFFSLQMLHHKTLFYLLHIFYITLVLK